MWNRYILLCVFYRASKNRSEENVFKSRRTESFNAIQGATSGAVVRVFNTHEHVKSHHVPHWTNPLCDFWSRSLHEGNELALVFYILFVLHSSTCEIYFCSFLLNLFFIFSLFFFLPVRTKQTNRKCLCLMSVCANIK